MEHSARFFANKDCEYYPCHKGNLEINCLFCFCPLYDTDCPGNYKMTEKNGRLVKSCIDCVFPHVPENYDRIMELLRSR
ncbi:MAG: cysteine-rich small domain-containing protein [Lachnospiraceae bacterium]|nr:cysteine-rich small domain-containing protein [Lachnospiraceae bacterium]